MRGRKWYTKLDVKVTGARSGVKSLDSKVRGRKLLKRKKKKKDFKVTGARSGIKSQASR